VADWRVQRDIPEGGGCLSLAQEMIVELTDLGATFFRVTSFSETPILSVEGWRTQPDDQGPELKIEDVIGFGT
jgi:hypothetical protein